MSSTREPAAGQADRTDAPRDRSAGTDAAATPRPIERPLHVAELARRLGLERSALGRALQNSPNAPQPADCDDKQRPLYWLAQVAAFWPHRARRGPRPGAGTGAQAATRVEPQPR